MTTVQAPASAYSKPELSSWRRVSLSAAPAVGGYLAVRVVGVLVLWAWAHSEGQSVLELLGNRDDSVWYRQIIDHGYDHPGPAKSDLAFLPLYPMLVRGLAMVTPAGPTGVALVLAWLAGAAAAWGLYVLGTHLHDRRTGIMLAILWGVLPHAIVESLAYTESLFAALAVWALYAVLTERWLLAGALCLLAGLTRPTAPALVAVVCLAALVAVVRRPSAWRPWVAMVVAPLGWIGYLVWVGLRVGRLDGWFWIEDVGWKTGFDGGGYTLGFAAHNLKHGVPYLDFFVVVGVLLGAVALFALSIVQRQPWQLLLYSAVLLVLALGESGMFYAKARLLLVAVPLLLPAAVAFAKARTVSAVITLTTLTMVSAYFGGYLCLVWKWSP